MGCAISFAEKVDLTAHLFLTDAQRIAFIQPFFPELFWQGVIRGKPRCDPGRFARLKVIGMFSGEFLRLTK